MYSIKIQAMLLSIGAVLTLRSAFLDSCNDPDDFCMYTKAPSGAFVVLASVGSFLTVDQCKPYSELLVKMAHSANNGLLIFDCTADSQHCTF